MKKYIFVFIVLLIICEMEAHVKVTILSCPNKYIDNYGCYCDTVVFSDYFINNRLVLQKLSDEKCPEICDINDMPYISVYVFADKKEDTLKIFKQNRFLLNGSPICYDDTLMNYILEQLPSDHYILYE